MAWNEYRYLGKNNASNDVDTTLVASNADGTVLERLEWIQVALGGTAIQLRVQQSASGVVEETDIIRFAVGLMDMDSGAIASANIDITSITQTMERSRNGSAYSAISDPTVSFSKSDGLVYMDYEFKAAQWQVGDMYRMSLKGITCTIAGDTAYVPAMIWNNIVVEAEDLTNNTQYLYGVADSGTVYPTKVVDNSILSILMTKQSGGNTSDFDNSTDSLEAMSDKVGGWTGDGGTDYNDSIYANLIMLSKYIADGDGDFATGSALPSNVSLYNVTGAFSGDGGAAQDDSIKASLDLAHTDLDALLVDTAPLWDTTLTGASVVSGSLASFVATGGTALGTVLPASTSLYDTVKQLRVVAIDGTTPPVANTLSDILHKDGSYTFDNTTDSLEAISDAVTEGSLQIEADAGSTASVIIDAAALTQATTDWWKGGLLLSINGDNSGQARPIVAFNATTDAVTVSPPFLAAPTAGDDFLVISGFKMPEWVPVPAVAVNATAVTSPGVDLLDLVDTDNKETYRLNNFRIKCADPGANTVTITLYELINAVSTAVDTFTITTDNYTTYFSLFDMFGLAQVSGDDITINATTSAGSYAITGNYQYDISYNA